MLFNKKSKVANTLIKIILIALFFYIIYNQIFIENDAELMWKEFELTIKHGNFLFLFLAIILMAFNWGLESLKWQFMISGMEKVSFLKSLKTILIGITTGLITPLKIGDYFGRILMVENKNQWKAVWVTFIAGFAQNIATVVFGFIGLIYYFDQIYIVEDYLFYSGISLGLFFIVVLLFLYYNIDLALKIANRLGLKKIVKKISGDRDTKNLVPVIILNKVLLLSFLRYIVFSIQFYLIIIFFGINGPLLAIFESILFSYATILLVLFNQYANSTDLPFQNIFVISKS